MQVLYINLLEINNLRKYTAIFGENRPRSSIFHCKSCAKTVIQSCAKWWSWSKNQPQNHRSGFLDVSATIQTGDRNREFLWPQAYGNICEGSLKPEIREDCTDRKASAGRLHENQAGRFSRDHPTEKTRYDRQHRTGKVSGRTGSEKETLTVWNHIYHKNVWIVDWNTKLSFLSAILKS